MFKNLNIGPKILLAFAVIAIVTVAIIALLSFSIAQMHGESESFAKLTAVREMKANQIEDYFQIISDQLITQTEDRMIVEAVRDFSTGYQAIEGEVPLTDDMVPALSEYYQNEFLERLIPNLLREVTIEEYLPQNEAATILQDLYITSNSFETGSKHLLENPGDGSNYSESHQLYHPIIRDFLEYFGYYDIFFVDLEGNIVYSVFKEVDFGTSLTEGPYKDTNFARVFRAALESNDSKTVFVEDFEPYHPSYNAPAAFMASPIFDGEEKIGVLVFQMPIDRINNIMTNDQNWAEVGLGDSGETYLVGPDFLLRNQSRFLIEDSENYFQAIDASGVPLATIGQIRNLNSNIGLQEVDTEGTRAALAGETGTAIFPDYRGVSVLSAYKLLDIPGLNWAIMSEIDEAEAFASIRLLGLRLGMASILLLGFVAIAAYFFSRSLTRPLADLTYDAEQLSYGVLDLSIKNTERQDEIGALANNFEVMRVSLKRSIDDLALLNNNLEDKVNERTAELEASERQSNAIIELSSDAIIVIDRQGQVHVWNAMAEELFGYSREDMVGNPMEIIIPDIYKADHEKAFTRAHETRSLNAPGVTHELAGRDKDGREFPLELSLSHWEIDGKSYFSASIRDISERKEAEAQLRLQASALEAAANGIVITNTEGAIEWVNPAFTSLTGYGFDEAVGRNTRILNSGQQDETFFKNMWETIKTGQVWQGELVNKRKNGTFYLEEMTITPVTDADGEISRYVAIKQDITERKDAERAIREQEERIRSIVEIAPDAVISIDGRQIVTMFNTRAEEIFGYATDEVIGQPLTMLMPEASRSIHPQEINRFLEEPANARDMDRRRQIAGRRKDGTIFPAEAGISKLELDGQFIFTAFFRDITERVEMEQAIRESESRFRSLFEDSPISLWEEDFSKVKRYLEELRAPGIDDLETYLEEHPETVAYCASLVKIVNVNQATLDLYGAGSKEELFGNLDMMFTEESNNTFRKELVALEKGETRYEGEIINRKLSGDLIDCIVVFSVAPGHETDWSKIFVSITDITDRKEMETQLERAMHDAEAANRSKSAFLANMSHELRTPMNAIIGYSEMLAEDAEDEGYDELIPDLEKINSAGRHLLSLINHVLDLSKIEAGRMDLYLERFDLRQVLEETASTVSPVVTKNNNKFLTEFDDNLGTMRADLTKVRQATVNLLSNAAKFTQDGVVTLSAERESRGDGDWIVIRVADTGIGIAEDKYKAVFEEFSQADESTTRNYGGTGLGLPISQRFCRMMGGDISVTSESGKGSTFTIELPAEIKTATISAEPVEVEDHVSPVPHISPGQRPIIVIDDDPQARELLARTLEADGHAVITANNGEEGLELARQVQPSLITLDVMMPGMDGWTVLRKLKEDRQLEAIPVIMVSIVGDKEMGYTLGAVDSLTKPVDRKMLQQLVKQHASSQGRNHVLIVEDDESVRLLLHRTMEEAGWQVAEAENGAVALEQVSKQRPDLILLDLMMPVMDGFDFVLELRQRKENLAIPIIVVTAKDLTEEDRMRLIGGVQYILDKAAFSQDELLQQVRQLATRQENGTLN